MFLLTFFPLRIKSLDEKYGRQNDHRWITKSRTSNWRWEDKFNWCKTRSFLNRNRIVKEMNFNETIFFRFWLGIKHPWHWRRHGIWYVHWKYWYECKQRAAVPVSWWKSQIFAHKTPKCSRSCDLHYANMLLCWYERFRPSNHRVIWFSCYTFLF